MVQRPVIHLICTSKLVNAMTFEHYLCECHLCCFPFLLASFEKNSCFLFSSRIARQEDDEQLRLIEEEERREQERKRRKMARGR
jgi:hypothetical protein